MNGIMHGMSHPESAKAHQTLIPLHPVLQCGDVFQDDTVLAWTVRTAIVLRCMPDLGEAVLPPHYLSAESILGRGGGLCVPKCFNGAALN
jgi:hypothetical protein